MSWIQIIDSENSIKLRDQLGNFVIVPKSEALDVALYMIDLVFKKDMEDHVH